MRVLKTVIQLLLSMSGTIFNAHLIFRLLQRPNLEKTKSVTKVKLANQNSRDIYLEYECNDSEEKSCKKVQFKPEPNLVTII